MLRFVIAVSHRPDSIRAMAVKPGKQFGSNVVPGISGTCVDKTWLSRSCEQGKAAKLLLQHHSATKRLRA